ncbi:hypothetical protein [Mesorhizobium muleiense]|uniref:hypothetical protein n=1 Tax=Mesorhizobium muleiense TaxID=1004279 RepID=UPI001F391B58|nr:hypothetical protein [Mesorhizobium muleiense]MCF6100380.1 hypothetical protein [Mesorhizobium muleiense]
MFDLPLLQEGLTLKVTGTGDQIRFPETLSDFDPLCCGVVCPLRIRLSKTPRRAGQQHISLLSALASFSGNDALGAAEPSGRWTGLAPKEKAQPDPERAAGRARTLIGIEESSMGSIERFEIILFATDQIRRHREPFEVVGPQRASAVRKYKRFVGVGPGPLLIMPSATFEVIDAFRVVGLLFALRGLAHSFLRESGKGSFGCRSRSHLLDSLSPLGWEHVNLTGDYLWEEKPLLDVNGFQPIPFTL